MLPSHSQITGESPLLTGGKFVYNYCIVYHYTGLAEQVPADQTSIGPIISL